MVACVRNGRIRQVMRLRLELPADATEMLRNRTARLPPQSVHCSIGHIDPTRFRPQDFAGGGDGYEVSYACPSARRRRCICRLISPQLPPQRRFRRSQAPHVASFDDLNQFPLPQTNSGSCNEQALDQECVAKTEDGADVAVLPDTIQHPYYRFTLQRE